MVFKRGPQYRAFVTLENAQAAIDASQATLSIVTASASLSTWGPNSVPSGIGALSSVTSTASTVHEIKDISGMEPGPGNVDDPFEIFGQTRPIDNPIRKQWQFTITRKSEDKLFLKLFASGRFGATGSTGPVIFDGLSAYPNTTGYRLYLWDGTDFDVYMHGTIPADGYKSTLAPTGVTEEQITFKGGLWKAGVTSASDLTTSQSIVQA
jgi:hypothetical protein